MDGTLVRGDTLHEAVLAYLGANPSNLFRMIGWLKHGKAGFKRRLADEYVIGGKNILLNETVLEKIRAEKKTGRKVVLASAADLRQAITVAEVVGLFDEVYGTNHKIWNGKNLAGRSKSDFLTELYGERQFDYIGDSAVDVPVWKAARKAITIGAGKSLRRKVEDAAEEFLHLEFPCPVAKRLGLYLRAMRPHQWVKNLLIFIPMLAARDFYAFWPALLAFISFSMVASSIYIINDLFDLAADRAHPRKCKRPFAAGDIPIKHGFYLFAILFTIAAGLASAFLPPLFLGVLLLYLVTTVAYSLVLKRKLIIDVWTLAGLYTVRLMAGAAATSLVLSPWILGFSMFLFFALAAVKRQAELADQIIRNVSDTAGRAYKTADLPVLQMMSVAAGYAAVLLFGLYTNSTVATGNYAAPHLLWGVCPILLYWISRVAIMTHRGYMTDDPIVFSAKDRQSQICGLLMFLCFSAASIGGDL